MRLHSTRPAVCRVAVINCGRFLRYAFKSWCSRNRNHQPVSRKTFPMFEHSACGLPSPRVMATVSYKSCIEMFTALFKNRKEKEQFDCHAREERSAPWCSGGTAL